MSNQDSVKSFLEKAAESLAGAESEYANKRYQNASNRAYYACYQAAVAALLAAGVKPTGARWNHETVQALFIRELINRRKRYPAELGGIFERLVTLRNTADYKTELVKDVQSARSNRKAREFVTAVIVKEGQRSDHNHTGFK